MKLSTKLVENANEPAAHRPSAGLLCESRHRCIGCEEAFSSRAFLRGKSPFSAVHAASQRVAHRFAQPIHVFERAASSQREHDYNQFLRRFRIKVGFFHGFGLVF